MTKRASLQASVKQILKEYTAEPTPALMHTDDSYLRYIAGPFGSGKSSACLMEILMRAFRQQPDENNVRRSRWAIVRNTYPELKSTTIKTFQHWIPDSVAPVVYGIPITCNFEAALQDGTRVELEFIFMALDSPDDVKKLLSLEITGAYINEAREIPWEVVEGLIGRVPRYPETIKDAEGNKIYGATEPGILLDSNPPQVTHWLYEKFETGKVPNGWKKFQQPPAVFYNSETGKWELNPDAENLSHLEDGYYQKTLDAATEDYIRVNLGGEFGMSRKGKPVFAKYSEHKHVAKEIINPMRGWPVIIGQDFGLTPAIVLMQLTHRGVQITDELPATDETLEDFLDEYLSPLLLKRYQGFSVVACGDPAGRSRSAHDKRTSFQILRSRNIKAYPAFTNEIAQRIAAVNFFLGRDEGFLISPHCIHLREAMGGGYVWKESKSEKGLTLDTPLKNAFSHIADATQYGCLYARFGNRAPQNKGTSTEPKKPHLFA